MSLLALARASALLLALLVLLAGWRALRAGLPDDGATTLAFDALATAALLGLAALGAASFSPQPLAARLGLRRGRFGPGATALGALGLLGLSHALEGLLTVAGAPPSETLARFTATLAAATPAELALAAAVFALASAGAEELLFRGALQRGLAPRLGGATAVALAAALFALAHGDPVHAIAAFPLGLYLGVLAWWDGSIRSALAAHALNNAVAVLEAGQGLHLPAGPVAVASIGVGLAVAGGALRALGRRAGAPAAPHPPAS
jgi:membrane protease YdiL (CAAX protease family)